MFLVAIQGDSLDTRRLPMEILENSVQIMSENFHPDMRAEEGTDFGFAYTSAKGKAHVHCVVSVKDNSKEIVRCPSGQSTPG